MASNHSDLSRKAIFAALFSNAIIAVAKGFAAFFTGSAAMLAEFVHSVADCGNQGLLLFGERRSAKAPDEDHPFGYGKETFYWANLVAILLFVAGAIVALAEGTHKLLAPEPVRNVGISLAVLAVAFPLELRALRKALAGLRGRGRSLVWRLRREKDASLIVVAVEDSAALLGLTIAALSTVLSWASGNPVYDAIGSLLIGVELAILSFFLADEMRRLLIGESIDAKPLKHIRALIANTPGVEHIGTLRSMQIGPQTALLAVRVDFTNHLRASYIEEAVADLHESITQLYPFIRHIYIEATELEASVPAPRENPGVELPLHPPVV